MTKEQQHELSRLLAGSQEGLLDAEAQARLDELTLSRKPA